MLPKSIVHIKRAFIDDPHQRKRSKESNKETKGPVTLALLLLAGAWDSASLLDAAANEEEGFCRCVRGGGMRPTWMIESEDNNSP